MHKLTISRDDKVVAVCWGMLSEYNSSFFETGVCVYIYVCACVCVLTVYTQHCFRIPLVPSNFAKAVLYWGGIVTEIIAHLKLLHSLCQCS